MDQIGRRENRVFEVGKKVVIKTRLGYGEVGTVLRITEKRKDVVVQFPSGKVSFNERGFEKGADAWSMLYIVPVTEDIEEEIAHARKIAKCSGLLKAVDRKVSTFTDEQLDKVILILGEVENEKTD